MVYRILCIDGGGVRGIIPARVIARLVEERQGFLEATDCFSGTSSGAIISLALANGSSPDALTELFLVECPRIFQKSVFNQIGRTWGLFSAKYSNNMLYQQLSKLFNSAKLSGLNKHVVIPAFELDSFAESQFQQRTANEQAVVSKLELDGVGESQFEKRTVNEQPVVLKLQLDGVGESQFQESRLNERSVVPKLELESSAESQFHQSRLNEQAVVPKSELESVAESQLQARTWKAKFFHNLGRQGNSIDYELLDLAMRSSAAPTYLPIYQGFIDGGVVANNPAMCALAQVIEPSIGESSIEDVVLLSIGTGIKSQYDTATSASRGLLGWGFKLLQIIFFGNIGVADYQCRQLLGERYHRVNIELPAALALDESGKMQELLSLANSIDLTEALNWIDKYWIVSASTAQAGRSTMTPKSTSYQRFLEALQFTLKWEGGYVNDDADAGGATNFGITQRVYDAFRRSQRLRIRSVAQIAKSEVNSIYFEHYWLAGHCQDMQKPLNAVHFDTCVNFGVFGATKLLQQALGVASDGIFGEVTRAALSGRDAIPVAFAICDERMAFRAERVAKHPDQKKFLEGWLRRDKALRSIVERMNQGL